MRVLTLLICILVLAACVPSFQLKKSGKSKMWNQYNVSTSEDINELKTGESVLWTQDGPLLEALEFWAPIGEGEKLPLNYVGDNKDRAGTFRADMTPEEIVEFIRGSLSLTPLTPTFVGNLLPADFGDKQGYIVDFNLSAKNGADFKGNILFTVDEQKLSVVYFVARETHYYEARKPFFEQVVHSIRY